MLSRLRPSFRPLSSFYRSLSSQPPQPTDPPPPTPLLDSFSRPHTYLRLSLTERCNLRCFYCMPSTTPPAQPSPHYLTRAELLRLSRIFVSRNVSKIRLTGGEPLLRPDLIPIVSDLSQLNISHLAITTNAILLHRYQNDLKQSGLTHLNISLDTLDPHSFELLTKRKGHSRVLDAIHASVHTFRTKLNVVVMNHVNDHELHLFADLTRHLPLDIRFIEYMPFQGNRWSHPKFLSYASMLQILSRHYPNLQRVDTHKHDTSKYYNIPSYKGRIGFITSMTDHFCAGCNRIRITADGNLKVCLFGNTEISLRDVLRSGGTDADVEKLVDEALMQKHYKLGGNQDMFEISRSENRSMVRIGG